jgi:ABC-type Fe3+-hydroxamate transport system substrate-binding protein
MLEYPVYFLRWNMRLWYPVFRILGRVTGQSDRVETWITVTEENIQNTLDALGDE